MYRVFLGAPSKDDVHKDPNSYHWQTISTSSSVRITPTESSILLPPATLEAASRRISLIYQNIIFNDGENDDYVDNPDRDDEGFDGQGDQTTVITWPPTEDENRPNTTAPSFLDISESRVQAQLTQETQETQSYDYSDTSSIARFPAFHFNLHTLTSISSLSKTATKGSRKVNVLLAVLEVEGPDTIRIKKGADVGKEISVLKMILGEEDGTVCKLTAWRETADVWSGAGNATAAKRGDILLIENVMASFDPTAPLSLSASPYLKSKLEICYRTMPYTHEDARLRPDLRLGGSDASVRKVAAVVRWFQGMAGLAVGP